MAFVVFAGQSNIGGAYMDASTLPSTWRPDPLTLIWDSAQKAWAQMAPGQNTGYGPLPQAWGPEVQFAIDFRAAHPGETLYIVKEAQGGAQLAPDWSQYVYDWSPRSTGEFFDIAAQHIADASAALGGARPETVFWGQGETDAQSPATANAYQANLTELIGAIRRAWLGDTLGHVGLFEIGATPPYAAVVRAAEAAVVAADANAEIFDTAALPLQADNLHFTAAGFEAIGEAFYREFAAWRDSSQAMGLQLQGGPGADTLIGKAGDDTLMGGGGDDLLIGGPGHNVAVYSGPASAYSIQATLDGWVVTDERPGSPDGQDTLRQIQTLQFANGAQPLGHDAPFSPQVVAALEAILREDPARTGAGPLADQATYELSTGSALGQVASELVRQAIGTTSVATLAYQFFTGTAPTAAGADYLVNPLGPNLNNLNSPYYQSFNLENRYINFAVDLGKLGQGAAAFAQAYGGLDLFDAARKAYATIFGGTPSDAKLHAILDPVVTAGGQAMTRADYFALYGQDGQDGFGTKAAMVGWLMAEAEKADLGTYARSNDAFLADVALNGAPYGVDLIGHYAQPGFAYQPG